MNCILTPLDFSPSTAAVLRIATAQARAFGAKLWLIHVAPPEPDFIGYDVGPKTVREQVAHELRDEHRELENLAREAAESGVETDSLFVQGTTVETVLDHAERLGADLVVLGSHGYGPVKRTLFGSVSEGVLRHARCPVLIVPSAVTDRESD